MSVDTQYVERTTTKEVQQGTDAKELANREEMKRAIGKDVRCDEWEAKKMKGWKKVNTRMNE